MLVSVELGCEPGRCWETLVGFVRHVSHASLMVRGFCNNLLPQYSQVRDLEEAACVLLFAMLEFAVEESHRSSGGLCISATCEKKTHTGASKRGKISHAIMHKANACRSLNGQMHSLGSGTEKGSESMSSGYVPAVLDQTTWISEG